MKMKRPLIILLCLFCAACSAPQRDHASTANAPVATEHMITADGALPVHRLFPKGKPKAIVIALHGMNDYSHAFALSGDYLRGRGIGVFAYDQSGFGAAPYKGRWPGEANLVNDVKVAVNKMRNEYPKTPLFLMGESMGGAVAIAAVTTPDFPKVDGVILPAPAVWGGSAMNPIYRASLWTFAQLWPGKILTGEGLHIQASDNIPMLRELGRDPLVQKGTRVDSVLGLVRLMDKAYENMSQVNIPLLVLYGQHDQVIPPWAIAGAIKNSKAKFAYYPQGYHLLLRDLHRDIPTNDIISWLDNHNSPLPSGVDHPQADWAQHHKGTPEKPDAVAKWPGLTRIRK